MLGADDNPNSPFTGTGIDPDTLLATATEFATMNNEIIALGHKLGLKMWTHNCRGNYASRNMGGGSYLKIAEVVLGFLSHQCGFASCDGGNELTEAEQWTKIDQGQGIAKRYWGE